MIALFEAITPKHDGDPDPGEIVWTWVPPGGWVEVAPAGDVDGDGKADVVIGDPNWLWMKDSAILWGRGVVTLGPLADDGVEIR